MDNNEEQLILEFLKQETLQGHFESTTPEVAGGIKLGSNRLTRALERLIMKGEVGYRERGTERKTVRYYYLRDVLDLYRAKWKTQDNK